MTAAGRSTESLQNTPIYLYTPIGIAMQKTIADLHTQFDNPVLKKIFEEKLQVAIGNRFEKIQNAYGVESSRSLSGDRHGVEINQNQNYSSNQMKPNAMSQRNKLTSTIKSFNNMFSVW